MEYDFRADAGELRALLSDAVELYLMSREAARAEHSDVTRVELAFLVGVPAPPMVSVDFDTRPDAEADGDATHQSIAMLQRPGWRSFMLPAKGEKVFRFTFPDGSLQETDGDGIDQTLAAFLVAVLEAAAADGVFDRVVAAGDPPPALTVTYQGCPV